MLSMLTQQDDKWDDILILKTTYGKIKQVLFMGESEIIIVNIQNQYVLLQVQSQIKVFEIIKGTLPKLSQDFRYLQNHTLLGLLQPQLFIFNVIKNDIIYNVSLQTCSAYQEQYFYNIYKQNSQIKVLFYKISFLKSQRANINYDIDLYDINASKFKRVRHNRQQIQYETTNGVHRIGYGCGELFRYDTCGYNIQIKFFESNISHRIFSIYHLLLIDIKVDLNKVKMYFTYDQLCNQLVEYQASPEHIRKNGRIPRKYHQKRTYSESKNRALYIQQPQNQIILAVHFDQPVKYMHMLQQMNKMSLLFQHQTISLLTQN